MKYKSNVFVCYLILFISLLLSTSPLSLSALTAKDITVTTLQTFLEQKGLLVIPPGDIKGNFGPLTKKALIQYQASVGLPSQGDFGPLTKAKIAEEFSSSIPTSTTTANVIQNTPLVSSLDKPITESDLTTRLAAIYKMIADSQTRGLTTGSAGATGLTGAAGATGSTGSQGPAGAGTGWTDDGSTLTATAGRNISIGTTVLNPTAGISIIQAGDTLPSIESNLGYSINKIHSPDTAPTAAINALAGNLTGAYLYAVSFVTPYGETQGPITSNIVNPVSQKVDLTNIPVSLRAIVTARRIYRSTGAGSAFAMYLVATIPDNVTTTYTDNVADASLGALQPAINTSLGFWSQDGNKSIVTDAGTTYLGLYAGNGTGIDNTAVGTDALSRNTTGYFNTVIGEDALMYNTTGHENTAVGLDALHSNTTGLRNTAVGTTALLTATTVNDNTAMGYSAMKVNTSGYNNTAIGSFAMSANNSGYFTTAVGFNSLGAHTTGGFNTAVGEASGYNTTSGNYNTFLGYAAAATANNSSYATAIGAGSVANCNNCVVLGRAEDVLIVPGAVATPASATATCIAGQIAFDASYVYTCVATNTWRRAATATW